MTFLAVSLVRGNYVGVVEFKRAIIYSSIPLTGGPGSAPGRPPGDLNHVSDLSVRSEVPRPQILLLLFRDVSCCKIARVCHAPHLPVTDGHGDGFTHRIRSSTAVLCAG